MANRNDIPSPTMPRSTALPLCVKVLLFLIGSATFVLISLILATDPSAQIEDVTLGQTKGLGLVTGLMADQWPCGRDSSTAKSRGCKFESYTATWQPPNCFDAALDAEFRSVKSWIFFTNRNATTQLSWTDVETGRSAQVWTTWEFHLYSCAFIWKKEVKIVHGLVSGTIDYHQCLDHALMQDYARPKEHVSIPYWPRFTSCRPPSDISVHQFDLRPGAKKGSDQGEKLADVHEHSHLHGSNKEFDHRNW